MIATVELSEGAVGIEPHMVLKDIWGTGDREVEAIALWMADALVSAALRESGRAAPAAPSGSARSTTDRARVRGG